MHTIAFDYELPQSAIATKRADPPESAKLMVVHKASQEIQHTTVSACLSLFRSGDVLVLNNSKVFKARLFGRLLSSDGRVLRDHDRRIELFLVRPMPNPGVWKVLVRPGKHVRLGMRIDIADDFYGDVLVKESDGTVLVQFPYTDAVVRLKANQYGDVPIPPYIKDEKHALESYQTAYASVEGSVAAPTAGFHFTSALLTALEQQGVQICYVTLHVGLGTFLPVKTEAIEDHTMHAEWVSVSKETVDIIQAAKQEGRRVIAVGTTTVRTLEGVAALLGGLQPYEGDINIFITPGFQFQVIDALMTNFHLPKSTLLMLVSAFMGDRLFTLNCYRQAIDHRYRFYSFGDAMLIV